MFFSLLQLWLTAGYASAEMSISASAKLSYGNFGEEHKPGSASKSATNAEGGTITATTTSGFKYFDASAGSEVTVADGTAAVTLAAGDYVTAGTNGTAVTTGCWLFLRQRI